MITKEQYFGKYIDHPGAQAVVIQNHAAQLLVAVNEFLDLAHAAGVIDSLNPQLHNEISGQGNGGFRPPDCPVGAPGSAHKDARGVDVEDLDRSLAEWALTEEGRAAAERLGLYFEHPQWTRSWLHCQIGAPASGHRFFAPYKDIVANPPTCAALDGFEEAGVQRFNFKRGSYA